jgi:hypothetical protein
MYFSPWLSRKKTGENLLKLRNMEYHVPVQYRTGDRKLTLET